MYLKWEWKIMMKGRRGCVDDPHRDVRLFCSCQSHQRPDFKPLSIMLVSRGCLPGRSWNSQVLVEAMTALQWSHRVRWRPRTLFLTRSLHVVDQSVSKTTQVHVFSSLGSKQNTQEHDVLRKYTGFDVHVCHPLSCSLARWRKLSPSKRRSCSDYDCP